VNPEVRCRCGHLFLADAGLSGGITNCPRCGEATEVPGLRDPIWRILVLAGVVAAGAVAWAVGAAAGPWIGLACGAGAWGLLWLLSRAL
jgi:hypothetical protein